MMSVICCNFVIFHIAESVSGIMASSGTFIWLLFKRLATLSALANAPWYMALYSEAGVSFSCWVCWVNVAEWAVRGSLWGYICMRIQITDMRNGAAVSTQSHQLTFAPVTTWRKKGLMSKYSFEQNQHSINK